MKATTISGICSIFEQVINTDSIQYNMDWDSLRLIKIEAVDEKSTLFQTRL